MTTKPKNGIIRALKNTRIPIRRNTLANTAQAKKRVRQAEKARARNASQRSSMRTAVKKVLRALEGSDKSGLQAIYVSASSALDRAARKGLIHKNKAARLKSRLSAKIKAATVA